MNNKLSDYEKYIAKLAIMVRDGSYNYINLVFETIDDPRIDDDLFDFIILNNNLEIRVDSPEHKRLIELTEKYEIPEVLNYEVF